MYIEEQIKLLESRCLQFDHLLTQHAAVIVSLQAAVNKLELDNQAISLINTSLQDRLKLLIEEDLKRLIILEMDHPDRCRDIESKIEKQLKARLDQTVEENIPKLINDKVQYYIGEATLAACDTYFETNLEDKITEQVENFCNNLEFTVSVC